MYHLHKSIFLTQVSKTYESAKLKKLRETIEALHEFGVDEDDVELSDEFENYHGKQPDVINSELVKQKQMLDNLVEERQKYFVNKLSETI